MTDIGSLINAVSRHYPERVGWRCPQCGWRTEAATERGLAVLVEKHEKEHEE